MRRRCIAFRDAKHASSAAMRLIDAASDIARAESEALGENSMAPSAEARSEAFARPEFNRVTAAVGVMERKGVTARSLAKLRRIFEGGEIGQFRARA